MDMVVLVTILSVLDDCSNIASDLGTFYNKFSKN